MTIYKTRVFDRWAKEQKLSSQALCKAVEEMQRGLYEADLGGGLFKKRIARQGQGKSGGYRTLIATNKGNRWFFVFGFSKNERDNISRTDERALKMMANDLLNCSTDELEIFKRNNKIIEVTCDA